MWLYILLPVAGAPDELAVVVTGPNNGLNFGEVVADVVVVLTLVSVDSETDSRIEKNIVKPVLVVTSIKQPTYIKQPEDGCPKIHRLIYLNCIKQPPAFSSHILSFRWVAA